MTWTIRIMRSMLGQVREDLARPHPFAAERVGFLLFRVGNQAGTERLLLPERYIAIPDEQYEDDPLVGARIGSGAIRNVMQAVLSTGMGALHVHGHGHRGSPRFSRVDLANYPALIAAFRNVAPTVPHGALLLSEDSSNALVWLPRVERPVAGGRIVVVGRPMGFFEGGAIYA